MLEPLVNVTEESKAMSHGGSERCRDLTEATEGGSNRWAFARGSHEIGEDRYKDRRNGMKKMHGVRKTQSLFLRIGCYPIGHRVYKQ